MSRRGVYTDADGNEYEVKEESGNDSDSGSSYTRLSTASYATAHSSTDSTQDDGSTPAVIRAASQFASTRPAATADPVGNIPFNYDAPTSPHSQNPDYSAASFAVREIVAPPPSPTSPHPLFRHPPPTRPLPPTPCAHGQGCEKQAPEKEGGIPDAVVRGPGRSHT